MFSLITLYLMVIFSSIIACRFLINFTSSKSKVMYFAIYIIIQITLNYINLNLAVNIPDILNNIFSIAVTLLFGRYILKNDLNSSLLASMLSEVIFGIFNIVAFAFSSILLRETNLSENIVLVINSLFILVFSFVTLEIFINKYGNGGKWNSRYSTLYIFPLAFIYLIMSVVVNIAYNSMAISNNPENFNTTTIQDVEILLVVFLSLISVYVLLYFYEKAMQDIDTQNKVLALEVFTNMQKQYISEARQKYENTRTFRHDVNNHIKMLTNLIKNEEIENANAYLMRFEDEAKDMSFEVFTGNAVIDVLLKEKLSFAKDKNIAIRCDTLIPKDIPLDDFDLCIIIFNALDNAIKACENAKPKFIDIVAKKNKDFFVIDIINSFEYEKYEKGSGLGLETIKYITEKYGGYHEISSENNKFRISIMFSLK